MAAIKSLDFMKTPVSVMPQRRRFVKFFVSIDSQCL
jgi:hypothetical protein